MSTVLVTSGFTPGPSSIESVRLFKLPGRSLKAVLHGTTCNDNFSAKNRTPCNMIKGTIFRASSDSATCCEVLTWVQKLTTRCSIFRATMLSEKSSLQVVPCNTMFPGFIKSAGTRQNFPHPVPFRFFLSGSLLDLPVLSFFLKKYCKILPHFSLFF